MNAQIIPLRPAAAADVAAREDRRRAAKLSAISVSLRAYELTIRCTVPTLGNADAARALADVRDRLEEQLGNIEGLMDEFRVLADAEPEESTD